MYCGSPRWQWGTQNFPKTAASDQVGHWHPVCCSCEHRTAQTEDFYKSCLGSGSFLGTRNSYGWSTDHPLGVGHRLQWGCRKSHTCLWIVRIQGYPVLMFWRLQHVADPFQKRGTAAHIYPSTALPQVLPSDIIFLYKCFSYWYKSVDLFKIS